MYTESCEQKETHSDAPATVLRSPGLQNVRIEKLNIEKLSARKLFASKEQQGFKVTEQSDSDIIARVLAGDKESYRLLVEKYQGRAFAIAFDILKSREDAEDVVQESFVKAFLSLKSFEGKSSFYTWFYRVLYNMTIDYTRKKNRRREHPAGLERPDSISEAKGPMAQGYSVVEGPEDALQRKEQGAALSALLKDLSPEHRKVVVLREIEGMSYDDIARTLKIRKGTVMSRLFYARKRLKEALEAQQEEQRGEEEELNASAGQEQASPSGR